jgi:hypothetical protein
LGWSLRRDSRFNSGHRCQELPILNLALFFFMQNCWACRQVVLLVLTKEWTKENAFNKE